MSQVTQTLADTFGLTQNQATMVTLGVISFSVQALYYFWIKGDSVDKKWGILCLVSVLFYNIAYYKFFAR